ncbi:MAG: hypothetical protein HYY06_27250 [Deltaproteobacteria bacterium]|nr:hypothetical protein [Deltaproteobacteria bacterium]
MDVVERTLRWLTRWSSAFVVAAFLAAPASAEPTDREASRQDAQPRSPRSRQWIAEGAGVGGTTGYGRAGVLELGGSVGFSWASDFAEIRVAPQIGWFVVDRVELSAITSMAYINTGGEGSGYVTLLAEPSLHVPMSDVLFGFAGLGLGLAYADGPGTGFAVAPRFGANLLVGRSGVLSPALQAVWSTAGTVQKGQSSLLAVGFSLGLNVGFTVMW